MTKIEIPANRMEHKPRSKMVNNSWLASIFAIKGEIEMFHKKFSKNIPDSKARTHNCLKEKGETFVL